MKLEHRLAKLEAAGRAEPGGPNIIILCSVLAPGIDGPDMVAMILHGPGGVAHLERAEGETENAFELRARKAAADLRKAEGGAA